MLSLGIDPSLRSYGWCIYDDERKGRFKLVESGHTGTFASEVPVTRYMHFRSYVKDLLNKWDVKVVGIESPAYGGGPFSERHFSLMMFSLEAIFEKRIDVVLFDPTTLKLLATGKGNADKADMQNAAKIHRNCPDIIQSDECDAYHVARFAHRFHMLKNGNLNPKILSKNEKNIFLERSKKRKTALGVVEKRTAHLFRENSRFFEFSRVPQGSIDLPEKNMVDPALLEYLENSTEV